MSAAGDEKEAYVLPADADPDHVDSIVRVDDYDGKISELNRAHQREETTEETDPTDAQLEVNEFICPAQGCEAEHTGHPDHCPSCGAVYRWPTEEAA